MRILIAVVGLAGVLGACGGGDDVRTDCEDGFDNDGDMLIDDLDPGCALNGFVAEAPDPKQCVNELDDDGDGLVDLADWGCDDPSDDDELDPTRACNDGVDNDEDGLLDIDDPGCENPVDNDEYNAPACSDGLDNDSDGTIDYPFECGCISKDDPDEVDPAPASACCNEIDDDGDTFIDYPIDPGCLFAADDDEFHEIPGECGPSLDVVDLTGVGEAEDEIVGPMVNELVSPECNGFGGEFAYTYTVLASGGPKALVISTDYPETTLDTVIYVRTVCQNPLTELGCDDDGGVLPRTSKLTIPEAPAGQYFVIVDAFGPGSLGDFKVTIEERNGLHGPCSPANPTSCVEGLICQPIMPGAPNTCEFPRCMDGLDNDGDGLTDFPDECGCTAETDNNEADPAPLTQCCNGIDDDGDGFIDFSGMDPGCDFGADDAEIDECVPGAPVIVHPGGDVTGTTLGGSSVLGSPAGCGSTTTSTTPERVYFHEVTADLTAITFAITTASFNTVLYVRSPDCSMAGPATRCNDGLGNIATVTIADPPLGEYYAIVDGSSGLTGTFTLRISGVIDLGGNCDPASTSFICETGTSCGATGHCDPAACIDGIDNDGDGDIDYPFDPGCLNVSDGDETDPIPLPECADGLDNDMDGFIDFPADSSCTAASDNNESCTFVETFEAGVWPATGWTVFNAGGTVTATAAHDGAFGLNDPGWHYNTTSSFGDVGDRISVWGRPNGSGRIYFGFSAGATGAKSLVLAPNTNTLIIQENASYGFVDVASVPQTYTTGSWYKLELEFLTGNAVIGRLFSSDGTTLVNSVTHTFATAPPIGGTAIRGFGTMNMDTFLLCD